MMIFALSARQFYFHSYQLTDEPDSYLFSPISLWAYLYLSFSMMITTISIWFSMLRFRMIFCSFLWSAAAADLLVYQMFLSFDRCLNLNSNHFVRCVPTKNRCLNLFASIFVSLMNDPISPCWTTSIYPTLNVWSALLVRHSSRYFHCRRCDFAQHMGWLGFCIRFVVANLNFVQTHGKRKKEEKRRMIKCSKQKTKSISESV